MIDPPPAPGAPPDDPPPGEEAARAALKGAIECLLLVAGGPVTPQQLQDALEAPGEAIGEALGELMRDYAGRGLQIQAVAGGYQLCTRPEFSAAVQRFLRLDHREPLSQAALETLAIVAYRQPVSRPEVDAVRGVNSEGVLDSLLERRLIRIAGRKDAPGRPFLYETTREFLVAFGLRDLDDLPRVEGEWLAPEVLVAADGHAPAEQDPGPGGTDVTAGG